MQAFLTPLATIDTKTRSPISYNTAGRPYITRLMFSFYQQLVAVLQQGAVALATVVSVKDSVPRKVGAIMSFALMTVLLARSAVVQAKPMWLSKPSKC
ncbi:XdhC family protein [Phormidium sp. FACHB-592]|uniref:XdhC family protein n=1 Tax=Stenomitos frigidus AS-A4 TaxID=2933935 RepID=A0ABV0KPD1_9CYAN|nr:XdhC family protein [Phormidium sp. FACHB-592]MBD2075084.1 XdhC family protein [Phormidium sp. FACHB-592]